MKNYFFEAVLSGILAAVSVQADTWTNAGNYATAWYTNNTNEGTFILGSAADLAGLAAIANGTAAGFAQTNFEGCTVYLTNNVSLAGHDWVPIFATTAMGDSGPEDGFRGQFFGGDCSISGMNVRCAAMNEQLVMGGLFGVIHQGGSVGYFSLQGAVDVSLALSWNTIIAGADVSAGLVAGISFCSMDSITAEGVVTSRVSSAQGNASIRVYAGGLCGVQQGDGQQTIRTCSFKNGSVVATSSAADCYAGGLVGELGSTTIVKCMGEAQIVSAAGKDAYAGGICGDAENATLKDCRSDARISATGSSSGLSYAGGVTGNMGARQASILVNCCANGSVSAVGQAQSGTPAYAGGIVGRGVSVGLGGLSLKGALKSAGGAGATVLTAGGDDTEEEELTGGGRVWNSASACTSVAASGDTAFAGGIAGDFDGAVSNNFFRSGVASLAVAASDLYEGKNSVYVYASSAKGANVSTLAALQALNVFVLAKNSRTGLEGDSYYSYWACKEGNPLVLMEDPNNIDIYVSPNGNDDTGDGSEEAPFATIPQGLAYLGSQTGTLYLEAGTYSTSSEYLLYKDVSITTPDYDEDDDATKAVLSAQGSHRIFTVCPKVSADLSGLVLSHGRAARGAAIYNEGSLATDSCTMSSCVADDGSAIYLATNATMETVEIAFASTESGSIVIQPGETPAAAVARALGSAVPWITVTDEKGNTVGGGFLIIGTNTLSGGLAVLSTESVEGGAVRTCSFAIPANAASGTVYTLTCVYTGCESPFVDDGTFVVVRSDAVQQNTDPAQTGGVPVPYAWLDEYFASYVTQAGGNYNTAAASRLASGYTLWQAYLAGVTNATGVLKIMSFSLDAAGAPVVTFTPSNANSHVKYSLLGVTNLTDTGWMEKRTGHRFYKVGVTWE